MSWITDRRTFLETVALGSAGGSLLANRSSDEATSQVGRSRSYQIENQFFGAQFDVSSGFLDVWRKDGSSFLTGAIARAGMGNGTRSTADPEYKRATEVRKVNDSLGSGQQLVARCTDGRGLLDFENRITLYDGRNALIVETVCKNASLRSPSVVQLIEPVRAIFNEGGACHWGGAKKVLTNGYMYYDPGRVEEFGRSSRHAVQSMWGMGFYRSAREEGLVIGFLENSAADGRIAAWYDSTVMTPRLLESFAVIAQALYNQGCVLKPGQSISSGRLIFNLSPDPFTALESYAQAIGDWHQVRLNPIVNGWCNWFSSREHVTEDDIVQNAEFAARHLKPYGLEYIQIDDGYQTAYGQWEGGTNFPHGMKWVAGKIRDLGLKPGIWLAPYCITEGTEVHQRHPEWLVRELDGSIRICYKPPEISVPPADYASPQFMKNIYGLDITHPGAMEWMRKLFDTVANDWGYDFIKIDFVEWTLLAVNRYYDPAFSKAAAYRQGFETIRQAIGPHRHLLDCGPMNNTVGLLDSTRIELDLEWLNWEQYTKNFNSNAPAMAKRYYFHKRTWINDDDHLGLALLTIPQAQAAATIVALSGGTMISGDRLIDLDPFRLEILKKVYPTYGEAARPVDLFERDKPEIFALPVKTNFGQWTLVGIFNYDENAMVQRHVSLDSLRLDPAQEYVAYEFWSQSLLGEARKDLSVTLEPSSVALVALHARQGVPQVVSTDRHYGQGALELENVTWEGSSMTLRGVSLGPQGTAHNVAVYVPDQYAWAEKLTGYFTILAVTR